MASVEGLLTALASDAATAISKATVIGRQAAAEPTQITVTIYDKFWVPLGECHDYIQLSASKPRNKPAVLNLNLKGSDPLVPLIRKCRKEVVGITVEVGSLRWAYTVDTASYKLANGMKTLEVKALGLHDYLSYLLVYPNFLAPLQVQVPTRAVFIGPICTCIEVMIAEQAFRMQTGLWELTDNALSLNADWQAWIGTLLESRGNVLDMLHTPIYVVHHNPLIDASPFVEFNSRMETCYQVIEKLVKSYGVTVEMDLWLPGDPQPDQYSMLGVPTYVVRVVDRSDVTGPTNGTILDSIVKEVVNVEGSILGNVLDPLLNPTGEYAPPGVYIAPTLGVDFVAPWAILVDHPRGPMESFELTDHHPQGWAIVIGGKSPKWIQDLINATTSWLIDSLSILIGVTGIPSNLLDGLLADVLFAFQTVESFGRRNDMGPYGRPSKFVPTGAAPYNIDALFSFISTLWDTRGYRSGMAQFRNGYPYAVGKDIFPGALMSIAENGELYTDYIENVMITDNRKERCSVIVQIGDNKAEEAPIARFQRLITGIQEAVNILTLAPQ